MAKAKVLIPAIAGGAALAVAATFGVASAMHTNNVNLSVDGAAAKTVSVREDTVGDVLKLEGINLGEHDVVQPSADTKVTDGLEISVSYGRQLELNVDGKPRTVWTTARTVGEALQQLRLDEADAKVSASRSAGIGREGLDLSIATPKDVTVTAAGKNTTVRAAGTVQDALTKAGLTADADDKVTPAANTALTDATKISFVKVDVKETSKNKEVGFKKTEVGSDKLDKGDKKVTTKGAKGISTETYVEVYHDGKLVSSKLKSAKVTKKPVDEVVTVGTKKKDKDRDADESGKSDDKPTKPKGKDSGSGSKQKAADSQKKKDRQDESSSGKDLPPAVGASCKASYYWQGQMTATGERFNPSALTAAHKTMKFGTRLKVTNPKTGKSVIVRINDRGPYIKGRCLDLSKAAMQRIGGTASGVITVTYQVVS